MIKMAMTAALLPSLALAAGTYPRAHVPLPLRITLSPTDCKASPHEVGGPDCRPAVAEAVARCRQHGPGCGIVLAPGSYRVSCPDTYVGPYGYVLAPAAVDLSNTSGITFGAASSGSPALLVVDYIGAGCPAIGATDSRDVRVQNVALDTQRLPWTDGVVSSSANGLSLFLAMAEPNHSEWNPEKYPWLGWVDHVPIIEGATSSSWDADSGVATLHFSSPRHVKNGTRLTNARHFRNMPSWGVYGLRVQGFYTLDHVNLLSAGGMGIRCDFCNGTFSFLNSSVQEAAGRTMSTTADGVHFMHHRGSIVMRDSVVSGTGDDCFNVHGNFIIISDILGHDRRSARYIDETGPGWFPGLAQYLKGDRVAFFSRLTLQQIGADNMLVEGTGGFGPNASLAFRDPIPKGVLRYDMLISLDRVSSLDVEGCTFNHGGRGLVISSVGVRIVNNSFHNGFGDSPTNSILFLDGGCGAYEDYTEGPFSKDIWIANNRFTTSEKGDAGLGVGAEGAIQLAGCRPIGNCSHPAPGPSPAPAPGPAVSTPSGTLGPQPTGKAYNLGGSLARYVRAVSVTLPSELGASGGAGGSNITELMYWDSCSGAPPVQQVSMAVYEDEGGAPGARLALAGHWVGGDQQCSAAGWRTAAVRTPVSARAGQQLWLVHWYGSGSWNTVLTQGPQQFFLLENASGLPVSLTAAKSEWKFHTEPGSGIPLRLRLGAAPPGPPAPPAPSPPVQVGNTCSYNGDVKSGECVCDAGWRGRVCDVLDERPTHPSAGYQAPDDRSTWLGSVVPRKATKDFALLVDDIRGHHCAGEPAYYLTSTTLATSSNPLGPFTNPITISPQVTMHPTATQAPTGETIVTSFRSAANTPLPSSTDCGSPNFILPCSRSTAHCKPFKGLADANMTVQLLIGNASSPERPWENLPILTSADLPGQYSSNWEAIWGTWDPAHVILPTGETFVSTAHGNLTRGTFLFRAPRFRGPYTPVGEGPVINFEGTPVQTCDPFLFHTKKRGGALHIIANNCAEKHERNAGGYVHAVAPGPAYDNFTLTEGSAACFANPKPAACENPIKNEIALLGGGSVPFSSSRQSLTILFDEDSGVPLVCYTNLIGARAGEKWTAYDADSSLNAVPIGDRGAEFAAKLKQLEQQAADQESGAMGAPPNGSILYPPCDPGGSTQPHIEKHPDSLYPGPGRITEPGQVLNQAGLTIFSNVTVRDNVFTANGRFLDVGATNGVVVEGNRLRTPTQPHSYIRLYGSSGFDKTRIEGSNVCESAGKQCPCTVDASDPSPDV